MGKVQIEMEKVISSWCGAEAGTYTAEDELKGIWIDHNGTALKYRPKGINKLIKKIHENEFFAKCDPPDIKFGSFVEGGAIQKVSDLHDFLNPCEPQD